MPVKPVDGEGSDITYHDPCYLGRHNKVYDAPRELIGASGAKLTEMPRHADRGLCCGAGGARMWMEEHIGKRVNHERVEEALDTGASKIATGCPFCRVMMTDGVDDVAAANDLPKAEVLDVAQLLLGSLDTSSVTLPEKGTAAKEAEERAREEARRSAGQGANRDRRGGTGSRAGTEGSRGDRGGIQAGDRPRHRGRREAPGCQEDSGRTRRAEGRRRPPRGSASRRREAPRRQEDSGRTRRAEAADAAEAERGRGTAEPKAEVKGLGIAAGATRPGAKKAPAKAAPNEGEATVTQPPNVDPDKAEPGAKTDTADSDLGVAKPEPEVKGLGIAAGARRPGAKKAPAAAVPPNPLRRSRNRKPTANPRLRLSLPARATAKRLHPGERPGHRKGRASAGEALTSAKDHSPVSIGKFDLPSMRR